MRVAYLLIGLFLGMWVTTKAANHTMAVMEGEWDKQFTAACLTGYSEGWTRGRDYTEALMRWYLGMCANELEHCHKDRSKK